MTVFLVRKDTQPHEFKNWLENYVSTRRPDATSNDLARLYATSVVAYRAGNKRADNVALAPMVIKNKADEPLPKTDPLVRALLKNYRDNMRRSELSLCFWGRNLLWKKRNYSGTIYSLRWVNPTLWYQDEHFRGGLKGFRVVRSRQGIEVPRGYIQRADAVYMHGIDFEDDFDGVAPVEVAFRYAELGVEMVETQVNFMRNRAVPAAIVQPAEHAKQDPDKEERDRMQRLLQRLYQGAQNAGRTLINRFRWEWVQLQGNWHEMAFKEQFDQAYEAVAIAFDLPIALIREAQSNYSQAEVARRDWAQSWLVPRWEWYAEIFTEELCNDSATLRKYGSGLYVEPDTSKVAILKEDMAAKTNVLNAQVQGGYRSLYSAAKAVLADADGDNIEHLQNLYNFGGVIVRISNTGEITPVLQQAVPFAPADGPSQVDDSAHPLPPRPTEAGEGGATMPRLATQADAPPKSLCVMIGLSNNPDLIALQNTCKERCAAIPVKWNDPSSFHVTLIDAPTVTEEQIKAMIDALDEIAWPEDMALRIGSLNSFDNLGEHALHFRIRNNPDLLELQEALYDTCVLLGIQLSTYSLPQNYKPHVTMGYAEQKIPAIIFHSKITVQPQEIQLSVGDDMIYHRKWSETPTGKSNGWVSDTIFKELTDWRKICERKGRQYAFEPVALKGNDIVTFIREALAGEHDIERVFDVAKSAIADKVDVEVAFERLDKMKGISDYRRTIRSQVRGFWAGQISKFDFVDGMYSAVRRNFRAAWLEVAREYGRETFTEEELNRLEDEINSEARFITGFADAIEEGSKAKGGLLTPLFQRADLWVTGFDRQRELAKVVLGKTQNFKWVRDPAKDSCEDCIALDGLVLTGEDWEKLDIHPGSSKLACSGRRCGCKREPTNEPVSDRQPPMLKGPKKSVGDEEHIHEPEAATV